VFGKMMSRRVYGAKREKTTRGWRTLYYNEFCNLYSTNIIESHGSSVGIALGYGLEDRGSKVPFPARTGNFSLHHHVQNGSGAHPASYPIGSRGSFPGGKAAGA
jgi:hypothetical protein